MLENNKTKYPEFGGWCFAVVNGKLAEIHFDKKKKVWGHCFVKRSAYKTKIEQKMIDVDIKKARFTYKNKKYKEVIMK